MVKFDVLDFAIRDKDKTHAQAFQDAVALAQLADELGYHRFWLAEHHNVPAYPNASPEILMTHLLNQTKHIHLGSGGIMLPHYSPMKVAEIMNTISVLFPGRVDVGLGSNPGLPVVRAALDGNKSAYLDQEEAIQDVRDFISQEANRYGEVKAHPIADVPAHIWTLSASEKSAYMAARLGIGYTYSLLFNQDEDSVAMAGKIAKIYRDNYQPSTLMPEPHFIVSAFVAVTATEAELAPLQRAFELWILGKNNYAEFDHIPTIEEAAAYQFEEADLEKMARTRKKLVIGDIASVKAQLQYLIDLTDADEMMVIPTVPDIEERKNALRLIADAFELEKPRN